MKLTLEKEDAKREAEEIDELELITLGSVVEETAGGNPGLEDDNIIWGT